MLVFGLLLVIAAMTGCVRDEHIEPAGPRAGCEATGVKWHTVTQTCEKR
jgi:hypothetical protein